MENFDRTGGVYIDATGQPRGIPNAFKARNEIAAGFESLISSIGVSQNVEWINYIYYNQERFLNYTETSLRTLWQQLSATSQMAWQNRKIFDWMLAREGGVCSMFGDKCCTFIPNHTEPGGNFYEAMCKLSDLREELSENSRINPWSLSWVTKWLDGTFGGWGAWIIIMGGILLIILVIIGLLGCCVFPCVRSLCVQAIVKQMLVRVSSSRTEEKGPLIDINMREEAHTDEWDPRGWAITEL